MNTQVHTFLASGAFSLKFPNLSTLPVRYWQTSRATKFSQLNAKVKTQGTRPCSHTHTHTHTHQANLLSVCICTVSAPSA